MISVKALLRCVCVHMCMSVYASVCVCALFMKILKHIYCHGLNFEVMNCQLDVIIKEAFWNLSRLKRTAWVCFFAIINYRKLHFKMEAFNLFSHWMSDRFESMIKMFLNLTLVTIKIIQGTLHLCKLKKK